MKILVTGGSGFLGRQLVKKLLHTGHNVLNIDRINSYIVHENFAEIIGDLCDLNSLFGADVVIHCAAAVPKTKNKKEITRSNVIATEKILSLAFAEKSKKFIFISSSAVYGKPSRNPVRIGDPKIPIDIYGKSKLEGELLCYKYLEKGLMVSIVRPRTILGNERVGIFGTLFSWVYNGRRIPIFSNGLNKYQFVDIDDFLDALYLVVNSETNLELNIGAPDSPCILDTLEILCTHANTGAKVIKVPSIILSLVDLLSTIRILPFAPYQLKMYRESMWFESNDVINQIQWQPKIKSAEAIIKSYDSYIRSFNVRALENRSEHSKPTQSFFLRILEKFL